MKMMENNTSTYKSLSINGIVEHYKQMNHEGNIRLFFKKEEIWQHCGTGNRRFYTARPLVVKVGDWYDDHINFSFVLKTRYNFAINCKDANIWCLSIDNDISTFTDEQGNTNEYHNTKLQYITAPGLINAIYEKYMNNNDVEEIIDLASL